MILADGATGNLDTKTSYEIMVLLQQLNKEGKICDLSTLVKIYLRLQFNKRENNEELQKDVQDAIKWEPLLNAAEIGVTVKDGVVTVTGVVDSYTKNWRQKMQPKT